MTDIKLSRESQLIREIEISNEYPTIHPNDLQAVSVIEPDLELGPWIAGGAALQWYQGLAAGSGDIDIFCRDADQAQQVIERIKLGGNYYVRYESKNAVTIDYINPHLGKTNMLQVINCKYFNSIQEVIDNFDISVCQVGTTGTEWVLGPNTARDIRERNLRFVGNLRSTSVKRLTKYWAYGYRPVPNTLDAIQNSEICWDFDFDGDYENAF